jgi:hypothetical protein
MHLCSIKLKLPFLRYIMYLLNKQLLNVYSLKETINFPFLMNFKEKRVYNKIKSQVQAATEHSRSKIVLKVKNFNVAFIL